MCQRCFSVPVHYKCSVALSNPGPGAGYLVTYPELFGNWPPSSGEGHCYNITGISLTRAVQIFSILPAERQYKVVFSLPLKYDVDHFSVSVSEARDLL